MELAQVIVESTLLRTESRGAHYRTDHAPAENASWLKNIATLCTGSP